MNEPQARFGKEDTLAKAKEYIRKLSSAEKESQKEELVQLPPSFYLKMNELSRFNSDSLFLQTVYNKFGLDKICHTTLRPRKEISQPKKLWQKHTPLGRVDRSVLYNKHKEHLFFFIRNMSQ